MTLAKLLTITAAAFAGVVHASSQQYCKPIPGLPDWPSQADWQALNNSVEGRLIVPVPPGLICHPESSIYSTAGCIELVQQWPNSTYHALNAFTSGYNDVTCLPSNSTPCSADGYPAYVINATNIAHVQAGVKFAYKTGVRLIIKGTGHDYQGRSAGQHALSIYTHYIRGVNVMMGDPVAKKHGGIAAVKIAAGMRWHDIYAVANSYKVSVVGGADVHVGIGGWVLGGGHSPISSLYGLGADQVIEMEVVTANGTYLVINEGHHPSLFWAMRGGGGSTFAVLISVTVRAYPPIASTWHSFSYNTTLGSDTYWSMAAYFHNQLADLSDAGVMGYYFLFPQFPSPPLEPVASVWGFFILPNKTPEQAKAIFAPMEAIIANNTFGWKDPVAVNSFQFPVPSIPLALEVPLEESMGQSLRLGSRLLDRKALETDPNELARLLKQMLANGEGSAWGNLVAGKGVKNVKIPGGSNAVLPAWRDAYVNMMLPKFFPSLNETAKAAGTKELRDVQVEALRLLAPNSGAYMSESDPTEPNWQQTFWGANYPRLLSLKKKWDPTGVFWCIPCVGHELWTVQSSFEDEGAIGQTPGRICTADRVMKDGELLHILT